MLIHERRRDKVVDYTKVVDTSSWSFEIMMYFGDVRSSFRSCLVAFVVLSAASALNVHRKCCAKDETLNATVQCVKISPGEEQRLNTTSDDFWWIPKSSTISASLTPLPVKSLHKTLIRMDITYNATPECHRDTRKPLVVSSSGERLEFEVRVVKDDLLLDVISPGTLHDDTTVRNATLRRRAFPSTSYCLDRGPQDLYVALICPCEVMTCIRKCCDDGKFFNTTSNICVEINDQEYPDVWDWFPKFKEGEDGLEYYRMVSTLPTCFNDSFYVLRKSDKDMQDKNKAFTVDRTGQVKVAGHFTRTPTDEFCGDATLFADGSVDDDNLLICLPPPTIKYQLYGAMYLIGGVALVLAVVVTLILPDQKLYDLLLLCHNLSFVVAYFTTGITQLTNKNNYSTSSCKIVSFIIQFSFLAAFFWLNVMCIDISWTFSGLRPPQGAAVERDRKKFIYYSIYAWGSTATISIVTAILEFAPGIPDWVIKPEFGVNTCLFRKPMATLAYFYGPMAVLLIMNLVLFIYTAARIVSMKRETAILRKSGNARHAGKYNKDKQRLNLYVKLFCLMGLSWMMEIISWWVGGPDYLWYVTDSVNLLRAVFIFIIFCCKRSVYLLVRARLSLCCPGIIPAKGSTSAGSGGTNDTSKEISSTQQTAFSMWTVNNRKMSSPSPSPNPGRTPNRKISTPNPSPNPGRTPNRKISTPNPLPNPGRTPNRKISTPNPSPNPGRSSSRKVSTPNPPRKISSTNPPGDSTSVLDTNPGERKMSTLEVPEIAIL